MANRYIITGGAGFIGANFIHYLIAAEPDCKILNLDKLTYAGNPASLEAIEKHPNYSFMKGDICDSQLFEQLLKDFRPSAIVHFAAESHVDRSIEGPDSFIETNILGTYTLLKETKIYWGKLAESDKTDFRFLHVSTDEVYGSLGDQGYFTETTPYAPNSPYSASKAASDHLVRSWYHTYGFPVLTTNCSNNYGPYQFPEKLIPVIIFNALEGRPLPIYGDGSNIRDWLHVTDHCKAIHRVIQSGRIGETYNVGGTNEKTNLQVVKTICALLDEFEPKRNGTYQDQISYVADRPGHDKRYAINAGKIQRDLGWFPAESFESGMRKTVEWYLDHKEWVENILSGGYRLERIGLKER
ncbi:MAG: dTDP-glucose 4,6-dehydratase [Deltaproteobacteria bacterium]|nr:dTDP-glucose 4,6-dehydratase [Deltaproteobacteria bacterium]